MKKYWKQLMYLSKEKTHNKENKKEEQDNIIEERKNKKEYKERLKNFKEQNEILRKCSEEGISCEFGICEDCILNSGIQMEFNFR